MLFVIPPTSSVILYVYFVKLACLVWCSGKGEFGTVYRATWHDSVVAVKVLNDDSDVAKGELRYVVTC